jgi:hypothetical protein
MDLAVTPGALAPLVDAEAAEPTPSTEAASPAAAAATLSLLSIPSPVGHVTDFAINFTRWS